MNRFIRKTIIGSDRKYIIITVMLMIMFASLNSANTANAQTGPISARIDLEYYGGIMLYIGADRGVCKGSNYDVYLNGAKIGEIRVLKVGRYTTEAQIVAGDIQIYEGAEVGLRRIFPVVKQEESTGKAKKLQSIKSDKNQDGAINPESSEDKQNKVRRKRRNDR